MHSAALTLLGLLSGVLWWRVTAAGDLANGGIPGFLVLYFAAAGLYLAAVAVVSRPGLKGTYRQLWLVIGVAVVLRLTLLAATPTLSTDCWRYVWEGRVQLAGESPYALAPDDPALRDLRDGAWLGVNHKHVPAIYGPLLQVLFALFGLLPGGVLAFKLGFLLFDLLLGALILRGLRRRGLSPLLLLIYLWHPLVLLEVAGQAHLELVPIALMVLALELELADRPRAAALALGCAIAAKYLPLLLVPAFLLNVRGARARVARLGLIALPTVALLALYLAIGGAGPTSALGTYAHTWRFNDGGFYLLDQGLQALGISQAFCRQVLPLFIDVPQGWDPAMHRTWIQYLPKAAVGILLVAALAYVSRPTVNDPAQPPRVDVERAAFWAGALFLLLSPSVQPWYALWIVPFLPIRSAEASPRAPAGAASHTGRTAAAWLFLSLILPLSYVVLLRYTGLPGSWQEEGWVRAAEYLPFAALLLAGWLGNLREQRAEPGRL